MKTKDSYYNIIVLCWWIINIILVWTAILKPLTFLSNIAVFALSLYAWNNMQATEKKILQIIILIIAGLCGYSLIIQNQPSNIIRFALIIYFICIVYYIKLPKNLIEKGLKWTAIPYCVLLILFEIYLILFFDTSALPTLRYNTISNGIGDIYPKYGFFYAIQLVGTAAIPFIFMLSLVDQHFFKSHRIVCRLLLLSGAIIAGNFGYIVAIVFFIAVLNLRKKIPYRKWFTRFVIVGLSIIIIGPSLVKFIDDVWESKKEESNATRLDQANVLIEDMSDSFQTILFGKGLGNQINKKTKFRDYSDFQYFELQTLYFLNQMGIVPFVVFILFNCWATFKFIKYDNFKLLYLAYITYSVTNPYILNTNQIVVIITLVSLSYRYNITNNNIHNKYALSHISNNHSVQSKF